MPPKAARRAPEFQVESRAVPRDKFPEGRVRFSLGTAKKAEANKRRTALRQLVVWAAWDVLHSIQTGKMDPGNVAAVVKEKGDAALSELRKEAQAKQAGAMPTVSDERHAYMAWYESGRRQEHSVKQVRSRLKKFCEVQIDGVAIGSMPITHPTAPLIEAAINQGWVAGATKEAIRGAVSGLYTWSIERERVRAKAAGHVARWDENPASQVEAFESHARVVTVSEKQAVALLANAELHQSAYVRVFLHMGLREDEMIHTRMHLDLDTETWVWRIQGRGPDERHGCIQCKGSGWTPKSKRSWRTLMVPSAPAGLRGALSDYLESYPCEAGDFLFRNPRTGRPWDAKALDEDFMALCKRAGVVYGRKVPGGITLHDLRATCATRLVQAKERESVIAYLLGDTVETIVNTYVRLTQDDAARAITNGPAYEVG